MVYKHWVNGGRVWYSLYDTRLDIALLLISVPESVLTIFFFLTVGLDRLEIFILKNTTTSFLITWGPDVGDDVEYTLKWYEAANPTNEETRETKNTKWLIQGLTPGTDYYITVESNTNESPNRGIYTTRK